VSKKIRRAASVRADCQLLDALLYLDRRHAIGVDLHGRDVGRKCHRGRAYTIELADGALHAADAAVACHACNVDDEGAHVHVRVPRAHAFGSTPINKLPSEAKW
jgi:hypothetical protein